MANSNLFVGGFPYETTPEQLQGLFEVCGKVVGVKILRDKNTGRSRGLAFVEMGDAETAKAAIAKLDGTLVGGRKMFVGEARPQEKREDRFAARPFAPAPAPAPSTGPGGIERRSGRDRRQGWGPLPAGGDRRAAPEAPRAGGFERPRKPWGGKPAFGEKKPWQKDRKPWDREKKPWEKKPWEKAPWHKKTEGGEGGEAPKPFGEKKPFGERKSFGDRKPFGERKSFGDRKPFGERKSFGDKKPFGRKPFGGPKKKWSPGGPKKWGGKPRHKPSQD